MSERGRRTVRKLVENIRHPKIIGRITYVISERSQPTIHHDEETYAARRWITEGNSLLIAYGPHESIWDFPVPEQNLVYPMIHRNSDPERHAVIASAKFNDLPSRTLNSQKRLHVPHMGIANIALREYTDLMGVSIVYMVPEALKIKLIGEHPNEKNAIDEWASSTNAAAIQQLTCILDLPGAIVEYFPEATRHGNAFIRAEPLLDLIHGQFRHRERQLGVLPVALFGLEHIQRTPQQGSVLGINPGVAIDFDVMPFQTFQQLREARSLYRWDPPEGISDFERRVFMSDVVMKSLSTSEAVPSPPDRPGIYSSLMTKATD
ncbi:hypothetical protein A3A63_00295 [Candidatus Gottesmanbacteria bacterium RIFCSPLOWO2_01_FULL_46_9]|uniref:Uncharacterized protein n=1 Tax=Candidatus Gottesmanbacteria bacterium RIFCSPLOWO2_01_FULL_46_9 TaxID=1798394 RepID=A0A1F6B2V2_9BACT|nr:MAG: hypothetical protein A3A63_00295 [Candidatus Gottesmanbacteria bacterium RIFCSPLOWO2_01_FULL_46_9]